MSEKMKTAGPILNELGHDKQGRARRLGILAKLTPEDREFIQSVLQNWAVLFPGEVA